MKRRGLTAGGAEGREGEEGTAVSKTKDRISGPVRVFEPEAHSSEREGWIHRSSGA